MVLHPEVNFQAKLIKITNNHEEDRNSLRKIVISQFIKEKAGHGNQENTSKYMTIIGSAESHE